MKRITILLSLLCVALFSRPTFADTLTLVSTSDASTGGEAIYPYNLSLNGSQTTLQLMCLNLNDTVSVNETWSVTVMGIPTDNLSTSVQYREDAYIFSQLGSGTYTDSEVQWAAWDIFDPTGAQSNSAFDSSAANLVTLAGAAATNQSLIASGFYNGFTLYIPTGDTNPEPQTFIGLAATPEPSSLILLGSGLIGMAGLVRRKQIRG